MGCGSCSTGGCAPAGCKSNGSCLTNGCSKLDVYDWLSDMDMPANYKAFNIVEVKFKGSRKDFYINHENLYLEAGELVVVETIAGIAGMVPRVSGSTIPSNECSVQVHSISCPQRVTL